MIRKFVISLALLSILMVGTAAAGEDLTNRWTLGLEGGFMKLVGGTHDYSNVDEFGAMRVRYGLSPHWGLDLNVKYGWIRPGAEYAGDSAGLTTKATHAFYTTILHPTLGARYQFSPGSSFNPYLNAAVGAMSWQVTDETGQSSVGLFPNGPTVRGYQMGGETVNLQNTNFTFTIGGALEWFVSRLISLEIGARYHMIISSEIDNVGMSSDDVWGSNNIDANTGLVDAFLAVNFNFGGNDDKDGDGIPNKQDGCPEEPEDFDGYRDEDGCPDPDNDGDGLLDVDDGCPDEAEDVDGYQDEDGCPDPDNDGDGILDVDDDCPDEPEDFDGFQDEDGCPDPDNDGDGVLDGDDLCDGTPLGVPVGPDGCPLAPAIGTGVFVLGGVAFAHGSDSLTPEAEDSLDKVAESMHAYPEVTVEIGGHTDSSGSAAFNQNLSQVRADAVRDYLIGQGIEANRLTAVGYGEDHPTVSNDTAEGRATNRRIEMKRTDQ